MTSTMNARTTDLFRTVVECVRANGGSSRLSREPRSLVSAGLVVKVAAGQKCGCRGGGYTARYTLTEQGRVLAAIMFPV